MPKKRKIWIVVLSLLVLLAAGVFGLFRARSSMQTEITLISARSADGVIRMEWSAEQAQSWSALTLRVTDVKDGSREELSVEPEAGFAEFSGGKPDRLYYLEGEAQKKDGGKETVLRTVRLFLRYDSLPNLPLLVIDTDSGNDPSYDVAEKPDRTLWGETQINNHYETGSISLGNAASERVKIKTRGNTSTVTGDKKSYKLKFSSAVNLLSTQDCAQKEWALLNNGYDLRSYMGAYIGERLCVGWGLPGRFVNVLLNGDWKGCYLLTPTVSRSTAGESVSASGYIFENDPYWWKEGTVSFRLQRQDAHMAYTFKYPEVTAATDSRMAALSRYWQDFEDALYRADGSYRDYIDVDSFAAWLLARDVLANGDEAGSNMYFYKYDMRSGEENASKVKMGPLWDFDHAFETEGAWSNVHDGEVFVFPQLLRDEVFCEAYRKQWERISPSLLQDVTACLARLEQEQGEAIDHSWKLDWLRWAGPVNWEEMPEERFSGKKEEMLRFFAERIAWMDAMTVQANTPLGRG